MQVGQELLELEEEALAGRVAGEASERVPAHGERQRGMVVVVEWAEAFVPDHPKSKSLGDPLDGEVAELLKFVLFHRIFKWFCREKRPVRPAICQPRAAPWVTRRQLRRRPVRAKS